MLRSKSWVLLLRYISKDFSFDGEPLCKQSIQMVRRRTDCIPYSLQTIEIPGNTWKVQLLVVGRYCKCQCICIDSRHHIKSSIPLASAKASEKCPMLLKDFGDGSIHEVNSATSTSWVLTVSVSRRCSRRAQTWCSAISCWAPTLIYWRTRRSVSLIWRSFCPPLLECLTLMSLRLCVVSLDVMIIVT